MDFKKYLDDSYKFVEGDDLYKINGGETYEQHMYGSLAYVKGENGSTGTGNGGAPNTETSKKDESKASGAGSSEFNEHNGDAYKDHGSWGSITSPVNRDKTMQQYAEKYEKDKKEAEKLKKNIRELENFDLRMNGETKNKEGKLEANTFSQQGCKMQGVAKIMSEIRGKLFTLLDVNKFDKDKNGLLSQEEITEGITTNLLRGQKLKTDFFENTLSKEVLDNISKSKGTTYVLGRAEGVHGGQHWVELEAYNINTLGQVEFTYNGTSRYDGINDRKYILGDPQPGQDNYFKISRIETYTINWEN